MAPGSKLGATSIFATFLGSPRTAIAAARIVIGSTILDTARAYRTQCKHRRLQCFGDFDQLGNQRLVLGVVTVLKRGVALLVAVVEKAPLGAGQRGGAAEYLKHDVTVFRTKAMPAECRHC